MPARPRSVCIAALCLSIAPACSSDSRSARSTSADGGSDAGSTYLGLSTPTDGFQVRDIGHDIAPGSDSEYCEVAQLPGEPSETYYVKSVEFGNGPHSHHLIVSAAIPGGPAEAKLEALGIGHPVECLGAQLQFGEAGFQGVGGVQQPYGNVVYPDGVGVEYHGGQYIVFDYHYLNSGTETVHAESAVNFHLADASQIKHLARGFGFYNFTIDTPPAKTGSFTAECHFNADVNVGGITRHTHRWGTDYKVWYSGGARDGQEIWTSTDWEHDVDHAFADPVLMKAGEGFRFQCNYDNTTEHELRFGTSASDEMCILFGMTWEASEGEQLGSQGCSISWIDTAGIGHPATEAGGFPKPTAEETSLCISGSGANIDACGQCRCDSCATPIIKCATDTECSAVLKCFTGCTTGNCMSTCQSVLDQHSSAVGLLRQMTTCMDAQCPVCTPASGGDAGPDAGP